jgi:hypothetical protein
MTADIFGKPKPKYFESGTQTDKEEGKGKRKKGGDSWNDYDFDDDKEKYCWNGSEDADGFDENKNRRVPDEEDDERDDNGALKSISGTKKAVGKPDGLKHQQVVIQS